MANPTIIIKHRDTHNLVLNVGSAGAPVDLTGAAVRILIRPRGQNVEGTSLSAAVSNALTGEITHSLSGTIPVGSYDLEVEITQGGRISTTPTDGYVTLIVQQDVA